MNTFAEFRGLGNSRVPYDSSLSRRQNALHSSLILWYLGSPPLLQTLGRDKASVSHPLLRRVMSEFSSISAFASSPLTRVIFHFSMKNWISCTVGSKAKVWKERNPCSLGYDLSLEI